MKVLLQGKKHEFSLSLKNFLREEKNIKHVFFPLNSPEGKNRVKNINHVIFPHIQKLGNEKGKKHKTCYFPSIFWKEKSEGKKRLYIKISASLLTQVMGESSRAKLTHDDSFPYP